MSVVKTIVGRGIPLSGNDIDTDRIIPARFLKCVTFDGLGAHAFDQPQYQGAKVLVVNRNFGCGSSREHAPQAIAKWGITALVGESFAEIFFGNCVAMGIPCVTASGEDVKKLQSAIATNPQVNLEVNLDTMQVSCGNVVAPVQIGAGPRQMFLSGSWDACGQLVAQAEKIRATALSLPYTAWGQAS